MMLGLVLSVSACSIVNHTNDAEQKNNCSLVQATGFYLAQTDGMNQSSNDKIDFSHVKIIGESIINPTDIATIEIEDNQQNLNEQQRYSAVNVTIKPDASKKLTKATQENIGKQLAVVIDGKLVSAPTIQSPIGANFMIISASKQESAVIVNRLKQLKDQCNK